MNVLVLIAGVADPKWPLPHTCSLGHLQAHGDRYAVLSPFDEASLELALKLRDADPRVDIYALVAGPESLARKVAEWRLNVVRRFEAGELAAWDAVAFARGLARAAASVANEVSLVLMPREFGDFDDGAVPPLVAAALGLSYVGMAVAVRFEGNGAWVTRQRADRMERVRLAGPALLAASNDAHNRLRHPLLKNVMAARKLRIESVSASENGNRVDLAQLQPREQPKREAACRMLTGTPAEQCEALARVLLQERAGA
jgi:electron transfer flavoprotein beta subunit